MSVRGQFSSRLGFILAAAGSAVGLGNIWGFPTQVADNGGAAFVLVYLILTFVLAYPILMAELVIGRYAQANMVDGLQRISRGAISKQIGKWSGYWAIAVVCLILSFYSIVAGWMLAYALASIADILAINAISSWVTGFSTSRNLLFCLLFSLFTIGIVHKGVSNGIEKWSSRLMPMLLILLVSLIIFVATQEGAGQGWQVYLLPDFSKVLAPELLISALGQAFFSLSLGVGCMLIYGSYVSRGENLVSLGAQVTLVDIGIAIMAGMLIIPAMYVAQHNGVTIFTDAGNLIDGDRLIFTVIPGLFTAMGELGNIVSFVFFSLMAIAALTSSISMLEVPVAYTIESTSLSRNRATWLIGAIIMLVSTIIVLNFESLFGAVIALTTEYSQPLLGLVFCLYVGWVWRRDQILSELKQGNPDIESSWFWAIWPVYVRFVCPVIILAMFYHSIF